jgi:hypothetical protein
MSPRVSRAAPARQKPHEPQFQAWIELRSDDPEAVSALGVARARLASGRGLLGLGRARLVEIAGSRRTPDDVAALLHASTQFYNPHKERCTLRDSDATPLPAPKDAVLVVVWERDGERRGAAERWWRHETQEEVEVREGVVWMLRFAPGIGAADAVGGEAQGAALELANVRDGRHGLLCNPWSQASRLASAATPLPWIDPATVPLGGRT